jgi:hypothetical protein
VTERETNLDVALRYVRESRELLDRYQGVVAELQAAGQRTTDARTMLATIEDALAFHRDHVARLEAKQDPP